MHADGVGRGTRTHKGLASYIILDYYSLAHTASFCFLFFSHYSATHSTGTGRPLLSTYDMDQTTEKVHMKETSGHEA